MKKIVFIMTMVCFAFFSSRAYPGTTNAACCSEECASNQVIIGVCGFLLIAGMVAAIWASASDDPSSVSHAHSQ